MRNRRIVGLLAAGALVVAACTSGSGGSPAPSAKAELGAGEGALNLIIWAGYAERGATYPEFDWVTPFEEKTGCIVKTTDMTDSANGVSLMQSGDYDGGSFSGNATTRLMAGGTVAPINTALIPNYANIFEGLKLKPHNSMDGVPYGVPHGRGPNLLMYNTEAITPAPTTWDGIWSGENGDKVSIYDSADFIADAALHLKTTQPDLGITNPYQLNDAQFAAAIALLEKQRDAGAQYWSVYTDQMAAYAAGDVNIGTSWQLQANLLQAEDQPVEAIVPEEGSTGWSDTWMIHSQAKNPNCMYMWMDHMASAEANGQATVYFGEAPSNALSCDLTADPDHCATFHAADTDYWTDVWYWTTATEECLDGRTDIACVPYTEWVNAWSELRS